MVAAYKPEQIVGNWQLKRMATKGSRGHTAWWCQCLLCDAEVRVLTQSLRRGASTKCSNCRFREMWKGCGQVPGSFWCRLTHSAAKRDLELLVSIQDISTLFSQQCGRCALTGVCLVFGSASRETTASLDRIDSSKGYAPGNIRWVHKTINLMRLAMNDEEFRLWCGRVARYRPVKAA